MAYLSQFAYYDNETNWGSYQYVSLKDVVNNFMMSYVGNHNLINNVPRSLVLFYAKNAIKELNYDAFKEVKALELGVYDTLRFILPSDYVNWVRVSVYKDGLLMPLNENVQLNSSISYLQDNAGNIVFSGTDIQYLDPSNIDRDRLDGTAKSVYLNESSPFNGAAGYNIGGDWYLDMPIGSRYGLNTSTANRNPTFRIDNKAGVINFSSDMAGETCILEYISDGMEGGNDSLISVNKLFEKYIYADIKYEILNNKLGTQEYVVRRAKKDRSALLANARIRIGGMHPGRLLMDLRGQNKQLK